MQSLRRFRISPPSGYRRRSSLLSYEAVAVSVKSFDIYKLVGEVTFNRTADIKIKDGTRNQREVE